MTPRRRRTLATVAALATLIPFGSAQASAVSTARVGASPGTGAVMLAPIHTAPDLTSLKDRADALRQQLGTLQDRQEWAQERLADARTQLDAATSQSISADQQLANLQGASSEAEVDLARRVRAIEQSGGAAALFSQALDASAITDVANNVAALNGVLTTDLVRATDAQTASDQMAAVRVRLDSIADERAALKARAQSLARQAHQIVAEQRALVGAADDRVAALVAAMERRAERQAAAQVVPWNGVIPEGPTRYAAPAIAAALSKLGSTYVWGAAGPTTFDCSGLMQWSYLQAGLVLPRVSSDQWNATTPVPQNQMAPGDLLFYSYDLHDASTIHHVAMYIGNGQMVHAPRTGDVVRIVPVYYEGLFGVGRPGL